MFGIGQIVALRADPARLGPVIAALPAVDGVARYRVFHAADDSQEYAEDQLTAVAEPAGVGEQWLDPAGFVARLTAARLHRALTDHVYALHAARIRFVPFQFRPLLRLARADEPRLLIADDVGVGKTIEAGLILKELAARQPLDNVLVVCPKALTVKWRAEMRRFDEDFRILDAASLRYCLEETHLEGRWPGEYRRAIVHYELLRLDGYLVGGQKARHRRVGLLELDPAPHFDLVIADEAHHVRTPGTNGHQALEYLSAISTALLLLSATPIQTSSRDLFTLLQLLRPELFPDPQTLLDMVEPNRHLSAAVRALREGTGEPAAASAYLRQAAATAWGRRTIVADPRFAEILADLERGQLTPGARVRHITGIEELNTLSPLVNRTRRRDIGAFTIREPRTIAVEFTPAQQRFYDRLLRDRREELLRRHDPAVAALALVTLERQAASCLPAAAAVLAATGSVAAATLTDDPEAQPDDPGARGLDLGVEPDLRDLARSLPADDPKFDQLRRLVDDARAGAGPGKVLVFSYFLHTLDYLAGRLARAGVRVGVVTGRTEETERQRLRDRFRADRGEPDALDVLLSSEVGCEGLDYEFCDRLVNYDIPWNPMRVEQRIGRIDRFGQQSPKVLVFNFVTPGTVEERVYYRCWERLGLFRDTLGDLEGVLGDVVQDLNSLATTTELTPAQVEERGRQLADNTLRLVDETRALGEASADLLGLDESLTHDLDTLVREGRAVSEHQIEGLVRAFLSGPALSGTLSRAPAGGTARLRLGASGRGELARMLDEQPALGTGQPAQQLRRWLNSTEAALPVTFSIDAATADRSLAFLSPTHPLVRLAVSALAPAPGRPLRGGLHAVVPDLPEGEYLFAIDTWETIAARPGRSTASFVIDLRSLTAVPEIEARLLALLDDVREPASLPDAAALDRAREVLDRHAEQARRAAVAATAQVSQVLLARRLASLDAHHDRVRAQLAERLANTSEPRIGRMLAAQGERVTADHRRRRRALEQRLDTDIVSHRIAEGTLTITHE